MHGERSTLDMNRKLSTHRLDTLKSFCFGLASESEEFGGCHRMVVITLFKVKDELKPNSDCTDEFFIEMMTYLQKMCD